MARHKLKIHSQMMDGVRWYTQCHTCGDKWVPIGRDGWYGRKTFDAALAIGIAHQKEAWDARRAGLA